MTELERNVLECASYEEKILHEELKLKEVQERWNKLKCTSIDRKDIPKLMARSSEIIYYLGTNEGIGSHMVQYNIVWNWAREYHRPVVVFEFGSEHYGSKYVSICEIFIMPKSFHCMTRRKQDLIISDMDCVLVGRPGHCTTDRGIYDVNQQLPICKDVNIRNTQCFGAFIPSMNTVNVIYPIVKYDLFQNYTFTSYYRTLFLNITKQVNIDVANALVFHWRRGDQLSVRCARGQDTGINCKSVEAFLGLVKSTCGKLNSKCRSIFVSTNEENLNVLGNYLRTIIAEIFSDISVM